VDVSAPEDMTRLWALLLDGTYRTNGTYVSAANRRQAETRLLAPGFWLLAPRTAYCLLLTAYCLLPPVAP